MKKLVVLLVFVVAVLMSVSPSFAEDPPPFILKWGSYGTGDGQFHGPEGVAVDAASNVYVVDYGNDRIQKFTSTGGFLTKWGSSGFGDGQFNDPVGIAVDADGNVYVADMRNYRIQKFTSTGGFLTKWGSSGFGDGQFQNPVGVAVDASGNVYVADYFNDRIQKFTSTGGFLTKWGSSGSDDGQFRGPEGLAVDAEGNVYVTDTDNHRISKFTSTGGFLTKWGSQGSGDGQFQNPWSVAVDAAGDIYVTDVDQDRIQKFTSIGEFLTTWGSSGSGDGQFYSPTGVAVNASGNIYITDTGNDRVHEFGLGSELSPVVLVHGICSDSTMWDGFDTRLRERGFRVYADLNLTPNDGHPEELVGDFESYIASIPTEKVNVIAHSMGGLVVREYMHRHGDYSRVSKLVTLGTPHHGSDLARLAFMRGYKDLLKKLEPVLGMLVCQPYADGLQDLVPNSRFLNCVNYDGESKDKPGDSSAKDHDPEIQPDPDAAILAVQGTQTFQAEGVLGWLARKSTALAWSPIWLVNRHFPTLYPNDGAVGVNAGRMYNAQSMNRTDEQLGLTHLAHVPSSSVYSTTDSYQTSMELADIIGDFFRGGTLPSNVPQSIPTAAEVPLLATSSGDTTANTLPAIAGSVGIGQYVDEQFVLPTTTATDILVAASGLTVSLRTPTGMWLTPADTLTTPGFSYTEDAGVGLACFSIGDPASGTWTVRFDATNAAVPEDYLALVQFTSVKAILLQLTHSFVYMGDSILVQAEVDSTGVPMPSVNWIVTVTKPDSTTFGVTLYDDGAHADGSMNDGIFGGTIHSAGPAGLYSLDASAFLPSDSVTIIDGSSFELATFQDLNVDSVLAFSKNLIAAGDSVLVTATVRNLGADPVEHVKVEFWDNSARFCVDSLDLAGNGTGVVSCQWIAASPDSHTIRVTVDPFTLPIEASYTNNTATKLVVLGVPVGVDEHQGMQQLWLAPPLPNPAAGNVQFRIAAPTATPATLELFDLAGRRIRSWHWNTLPAGVHVITWDRRTHTGDRATTGIYFARLSANGRELTTKVVLLR